ncbi:MAG: hypothetical protein IJX11_03605 [Bacteroidales bacterium]|nr:hypothetical protein [Bacteroidales bacterium]
MKGYYHVSSHGLEKNDIFKTRKDFILGMNDIAICVLGFDVRILCFCLMSNHFHFVLYGTSEVCRLFSEEYKRRCAMRMRRAAGEVQGMRTVDVQVNLISSREYLENVVTYVLRNPIAAGIKVLPNHYRWSSADLYFRGEFQETGERLNDLSDRKRFRIMRSRVQVPDNYIVDADGMVLPSCYVDSSTMEDLFRHPSRLLMLLAKRVENDVELQLGIAEQIGMTDQDILTQMPVLIRKEFGKDSIEQLSMEQRIRLCVLLKRNYNAGIKQIARITRLEPEAVAKVV